MASSLYIGSSSSVKMSWRFGGARGARGRSHSRVSRSQAIPGMCRGEAGAKHPCTNCDWSVAGARAGQLGPSSLPNSKEAISNIYGRIRLEDDGYRTNCGRVTKYESEFSYAMLTEAASTRDGSSVQFDSRFSVPRCSRSKSGMEREVGFPQLLGYAWSRVSVEPGILLSLLVCCFEGNDEGSSEVNRRLAPRFRYKGSTV